MNGDQSKGGVSARSTLGVMNKRTTHSSHSENSLANEIVQTAHPERDTWLAITQNRELRTLFAQVIAKAHSRQTVTSKPYVCKQNKQMDDIHRDLVDTRRRLAASLHTILLPGTF